MSEIVVLVPNDRVSEYVAELEYLFDAIDACSEIREGYYSDESYLCELFEMFLTREEVMARLNSPDLPPLSPDMSLIDALEMLRKFRVRE